MNNKEKLENLQRKLFEGNFSSTFNTIEYLVDHLTQDTLIVNYSKFCEEVKCYNEKRSKINEDNKKVKEDLLSFVRNHDLVDKISLCHSMTKTNGKLYAHWEKVVKDLQKWVPPYKSSPRPIDSRFTFTFAYNGTDHTIYTHLNTFVEDVKNKIKVINRQSQEDNITYVKALEYIDKHSLDSSECVTTKDYVAICNEHGKELHRENLQGEEIDVQHSDGDDCVWEVGDHRCECGKNRYYLEVEGNFINGFYSYGHWC